MKELKDLKQELLDNKINNFYVFYGEDFGLKHHYIDRIKKNYDRVSLLDDAQSLFETSTGRSLFKQTNLYLIYNDIDFAKAKKDYIETFIRRLGDNGVIVIYEDELGSSTLFKEFDQYITNFPNVQENIALEFVSDEAEISLSCKQELAYNCNNDYSKICLECDKIRSYANEKNLSHQMAYDELFNDGQITQRLRPYNVEELMDDILQGNFTNLSYWSYVINTKYYNEFWISLNYIFNNYIIAYLIKAYGKWNGGSMAYDYKLSWNRTKTIREFDMPYTADYLLETAYEVALLDSKVKSGVIDIEHLFDYFLCTVI